MFVTKVQNEQKASFMFLLGQLMAPTLSAILESDFRIFPV